SFDAFRHAGIWPAFARPDQPIAVVEVGTRGHFLAQLRPVIRIDPLMSIGGSLSLPESTFSPFQVLPPFGRANGLALFHVRHAFLPVGWRANTRLVFLVFLPRRGRPTAPPPKAKQNRFPKRSENSRHSTLRGLLLGLFCCGTAAERFIERFRGGDCFRRPRPE